MSFYTDVICKSPLFRSVNVVRDVNLLEPSFRAAVVGIIADAHALGHVLQITETYRSCERQQHLFETKATRLKTVGVHHFGLAADLALTENGKYQGDGAKYGFLKDLCAKRKLIWGGDWGQPDKPHDFRDYDHVQAVSLAEQPALFAGTFYPKALA